MAILGYAVVKKRYKDMPPFIEQVSSIEEVRDGKPAILVGLELAKKSGLYRNILDKRLGDNLFWTFKKTENRSDYEHDMSSFTRYVLDVTCSSIGYYYITPTSLTFSRLKKILSLLKSQVPCAIYFSGQMCYMTYGESYVFGFSLTVLDYCGVEPNRVKNLAKSGRNNMVLYDSSPLVRPFDGFVGNKRYAIPRLVLASST